MSARNRLILSSWAAFFAAFLLISNASDPPSGYTGAPGDSLCTSCHTNPPAGVNGTISITGLPSVVTPNTTYTITLTSTVTQGSPATGGFQLVALNASNQNSGDLIPIGPDVGTNTSGGREYVEHRGDKTISNGMVSWMFTWTTPPSGSGAITMYAASNLSNNNNSSSGDRIITNTFSTNLQSGGSPLFVSIANSINVSCFGGSNGSATAQATGGTPPYTYAWSNGQSGPTASNLPAGFYIVTVTDAASASATAGVNILQPPPLTASVPSQSNVSCFGGSNGTALATAAGGTPPYSYQWSNGASGPLIFNLPAGTYTVTVTDSKFCAKTASVTITQPPLLVAQIASQTNVDCFGASTGAVAINPTGGTPPYAFSWSNGQSGPALTNLPAGAYTVTLSDSRGCLDTETVTITQPPALTASISGFTNVTCHGAADGSATVAASGGTGNYSYAWSNGANTATASGLTAGTYTVTVTDANQCAKTASVNITEPSAIEITASVSPATCFGACDGEIQITATGGMEPLTYEWEGGQTTPSLESLCSGTYSLTVTDANGCAVVDSFLVAEPAQLIISVVSIQQVDCKGNANGAVAVETTGDPVEYLWSDGGTTASRENLAAGIYSVIATDAAGCTAILEIEITEPAVLAANATATQETGSGAMDGTATADPSGGTEPYNYEWSNGEMVSHITGLAPGAYTVTVTDANQCEAVQTVLVNSFDCVLTVDFSSENTSCNGGNDGTATAIPANGAAPYSYEWSTGGNGETQTGLPAGTYQVTVIDDNDCSVIGAVVIGQPDALVVETEVLAQVECFGESTGSASVLATGGTPGAGYIYVWGDTVGMLPPGVPFVRNDLPAGSYTVTAADGNNCESSATFFITQPDELTIDVEATGETSNGANDGTASVTAQGGTGVFTYLWSTGETTSAITGLAPGAYQITVTDENGCEVVGEAVIAPFSCNLSLQMGHSDVLCFGDADGTASATPIGGSGPFVYAWSNFVDTPTISGLSPGEYTVTVTDASNCVAEGAVTIAEPPLLEVSAEIFSPVECQDDLSGWAVLTIAGGTSPYQALWPNGGTDISQTSLGGGSHIVTVTDAAGCVVELEVIVPVEDSEPPMAIAQDTVTVYLDENGQALLDPQALDGGSSDNCAIVAWEASATQFGCADLGGNEVFLTVFDANNNQSVAAAQVVVLDTIPPAILCPDDIFATNCDGVVFYAITYADNCGAGEPVLSEGLESGSAFPLGLTTVSWMVADASGNESACGFSVEVVNTLEWLVTTTPSCPADATGTATAIPSNGAAPYTFLWNDPLAQTTETAIQLEAGVYSVLITDATGCTATATLEVEAFPEVEIILDGVVNESNGQGDGSIEVTVSGGALPYVFDWSIGGNTISNQEDPAGLSAGEYTLVVTDANGCSFVLENVLIDNVSAVEETGSRNHCRVYPNPAGDICWVEWTGSDYQGVVIELLDISGRVQLCADLVSQKQSLLVGHLPPGLYWLRLREENRVTAQKLVISR